VPYGFWGKQVFRVAFLASKSITGERNNLNFMTFLELGQAGVPRVISVSLENESILFDNPGYHSHTLF
jgi:hypothetical protein